jgi:uncharacterized protein YegP (UPF0339 family)
MNKSLLLAFIFLLGMLTACKDFLEPSLENRSVILVAPSEGAESNKYQVGFWWEPVQDALYYRVQVATPDFSSTVSLVQDTLIEGKNRFEMTLEPGNYQWRIRAENGSSSTKYVSAKFIIHESSLSDQKLRIVSPSANYLSSLPVVTIQWDKLFGATDYMLQIDTGNFEKEGALVYNQELSGNQVKFTFPKEGTYRWRVRAQNETGSSKWSEIREMTFDKTPPGVTTPVSPAKGVEVNAPVKISWTSVPAAKRYKLFLYRSDGTTAYSSSFPVTTSSNTYSFNAGQQGEQIFWNVVAVDEAGNEGVASVLTSFIYNSL